MSDLMHEVIALAKARGVFDRQELRDALAGADATQADAALDGAVRNGVLRRIGGDNFTLPKHRPVPMRGVTYWSSIPRLTPQDCMVGRA